MSTLINVEYEEYLDSLELPDHTVLSTSDGLPGYDQWKSDEPEPYYTEEERAEYWRGWRPPERRINYDFVPSPEAQREAEEWAANRPQKNTAELREMGATYR